MKLEKRRPLVRGADGPSIGSIRAAVHSPSVLALRRLPDLEDVRAIRRAERRRIGEDDAHRVRVLLARLWAVARDEFLLLDLDELIAVPTLSEPKRLTA